MKRALGVLMVIAAMLGVATTPARAADFELGMEDEGLLLNNQLLAGFAVADWRDLGVDVVRIHARWWEIAPQTGAVRKPAGFNAKDPNSKGYNWGALDAAVSMVENNGMRVMLTITGPGPLWASTDPSKHNPRWIPSAAAYAEFARAVATRYRDLVDRYLIWNEPNQQGWLQPQWECDKRRRNCTPVAPHVYRSLVRAAAPQVHAADPGSEVVMGELAPVGDPPISANTPIKPLIFMREMGCVDNAYRTIRTGRCKGFKAPQADSFGYHPHPLLNAPDKVNPDPDEAQFADLPRLFHTLDKLRAKKRLRVSGNIHLTEFGYQTNPPDKAVGISLANQTKYLQQAAFVAWKSKRVRGLSYYQWDDEPVVNRGGGTKRYSGWQTGLRFNNGKPKPVLSTFPAPFVIERKGKATSVRLWGQVRPSSSGEVVVQIKPKGAADYTDVATVKTAADGTWTHRLTIQTGALYRYRWTPATFVPGAVPAPSFSGSVDPSKSEKTEMRTGSAL
ncbi:cellulase family glycosylhydrolase [Solirubrobacter soli]|uniref:cellulase family glycosylhydrolase n=1 Tax=Solirubrobacter soli TaxID=363832 RepID=UPI00041911C1|nr:cellulase family glycosylhydrolase [Solirubrobacter soli]